MNRSFEFMLSELPRRAFSLDPALQNDFEADNEDNRKWKEAAKAVRDLVTIIVESRLSKKKRGESTPEDLLEGMIQSYFNEYGEDGIGAKELVEAHADTCRLIQLIPLTLVILFDVCL